MRRLAATLALALISCAAVEAAEVPTVMSYQGRLTDNTPQQNPIDTSLPMVFRIFDAASGGVEQWSESWPAVAVTRGIFSVLLGSNGVPLPPSVFSGGTTRFLEVEVDGEILLPRQQLGAAAYAHKAETSAAAASADDSARLGGVTDDGWQRRVVGSCAPGESIRVIDASGAVSCEPDDTGIGVETDPKVGTLTTGRLPAWKGSALGNSELYESGSNVGVFTASPQDDFHVFRADADVARILATGSSQGGGMLFVGESATTGGGIAYDGDGAPDIVGGTDRVTLFRRLAGTDTDVLSFSSSGNDVKLPGSANVAGGWVGTHPSYGASYFGFWKDGADYTLLTEGSNVFLNAASSTGTLYFRAGNVTKASLSGSSGDLSLLGGLDVAGTAYVGYARVSASYPVDVAGNCPTYGGNACYTGSGCVTCPAGTVVIGGGCHASSARYASIGVSYPQSNTQWCCESAYDIVGATDFAYAICARLGN
jgi:hypothetical protein